MAGSVKIYPTPFEVAEAFAGKLAGMIAGAVRENKFFTLALSGGKTPELLYSVISDHFSSSAPWKSVHFFWGDERCVDKDDSESNYGMAKRTLLDKLRIHPENIHRIRGEEDPEKESVRYSDEIARNTRKRNGLPLFDMIILGLGEDGHTASIFPGQEYLLRSESICETAFHPVTRQKRITLTGRIINNAQCVGFLATGTKKAGVIEKIVNKSPEAGNFPASFIKPELSDVQWFIDREAASLLNIS